MNSFLRSDCEKNREYADTFLLPKEVIRTLPVEMVQI